MLLGCALTAGILLSLAAGSTAGPGAPDLKARGVPNLARVGPTLYRGGQPRAEGFRALRELGVQVVIDLRHASGRAARERALVEDLGMRYVSIPSTAWRSPSAAQVSAFLEILRSDPGAVVFVHCRRGSERTGTMIAAWRVLEQGWEPGEAIEEMKSHGYRHLLFPHLGGYVRRLTPLRLPGSRPAGELSGARRERPGFTWGRPALPGTACPIRTA